MSHLLEHVLRLPRTHQQIIPEEYMDLNRHMNVMYYTHVGNQALSNFLSERGIKDRLFVPDVRGMFALRQIINYLKEIRAGEEVAVHTGLVNFDDKRLHFIHHIVSLTHHRLCSIDERMAISIDMQTRRASSFTPDMLADLEVVRAEYAALGWEPHLSGAIHLKNMNEVK